MASARRRRSLERVKAGHGRRARRRLLRPEVVVVVAVEECPRLLRLSHKWNVVVVVVGILNRWQSKGRRHPVGRTRVDALHLVHRGSISGAVFAALAVAQQIVEVDVDVAGVLPGGADGGSRKGTSFVGSGISVAKQEVVVGGIQGLRLEETDAAGGRKEGSVTSAAAQR